LSRQIIWQKMKPLQKRFRDRPATGIGAERFSLHPALKPFEMQFATAILAEK
jgi:hypothetical protein